MNNTAINPVISEISPAIASWVASFGSAPPFAVNIPTARKVLGGKARSAIYDEIGLGNLDAVKDGAKTLITVESIIRYCSRMRPAKIGPPKPKKQHPKKIAQASRSRKAAA